MGKGRAHGKNCGSGGRGEGSWVTTLWANQAQNMSFSGSNNPQALGYPWSHRLLTTVLEVVPLSKMTILCTVQASRCLKLLKGT